MLVIGLGVAIVLMAVAANFIANLLARYPWIAWIGLLIILYVALDMIYDGSREVACAAWKGVWCAPDLLEPDQGASCADGVPPLTELAAPPHKKRHDHAHGIAGPTPPPAQRAGAMTDAASV